MISKGTNCSSDNECIPSAVCGASGKCVTGFGKCFCFFLFVLFGLLLFFFVLFFNLLLELIFFSPRNSSLSH